MFIIFLRLLSRLALSFSLSVGVFSVTRTFHGFAGARLLRPPLGVPVMPKNATVVELGGITPDASTTEAV